MAGPKLLHNAAIGVIAVSDADMSRLDGLVPARQQRCVGMHDLKRQHSEKSMLLSLVCCKHFFFNNALFGYHSF